MTNDSKHIHGSLSLIPTDWLCLRVAQMPTSQDLVIFVVTADRLLYPAHAHGVNIAGNINQESG